MGISRHLLFLDLPKLLMIGHEDSNGEPKRRATRGRVEAPSEPLTHGVADSFCLFFCLPLGPWVLPEEFEVKSRGFVGNVASPSKVSSIAADGTAPSVLPLGRGRRAGK